MIDVNKVKKDFPILEREIDGNQLVYLDNAATSQKPKQVVEAISDYYFKHNSNVHRGIHTLSEEATKLYEDSRIKIAKFIGADHPLEVVFTSGTTESLNMVAHGWALGNLKKGDVILVTDAEHHSNLLPWQEVAKRTGAAIEVIEVSEEGMLSLDSVKEKLNKKVKLIAIAHSSNVLGTIFPIKDICKLARKVGAKIVVDGAQAVPHFQVNVQSLGCDFYAFSAHKMLGPMGIGVLWSKKELLDEMNPYKFGGGMISEVYLDRASWADVPEKFEAGTPNVAGAVGLASAVGYLEEIGMENVRKHEIEIVGYVLRELFKEKGVVVYGPKSAESKTGIISFSIDGIHPHDLASVLDSHGIAVRSGQHCAMPLHEKLGVASTTRASFYLYNSREDVDKLIDGISKAREILE